MRPNERFKMCEYIDVKPIMVLNITSTEACKFDEHTHLLATLQASSLNVRKNLVMLEMSLAQGTLPDNLPREKAEKKLKRNFLENFPCEVFYRMM